MYGIQHGNNQYGDEKNSCPKTQTQLASDMGMDVRTLQNYKLLSEMIPELSDLVDTGIFIGFIFRWRVEDYDKKRHYNILRVCILEKSWNLCLNFLKISR